MDEGMNGWAVMNKTLSTCLVGLFSLRQIVFLNLVMIAGRVSAETGV